MHKLFFLAFIPLLILLNACGSGKEEKNDDKFLLLDPGAFNTTLPYLERVDSKTFLKANYYKAICFYKDDPTHGHTIIYSKQPSRISPRKYFSLSEKEDNLVGVLKNHNQSLTDGEIAAAKNGGGYFTSTLDTIYLLNSKTALLSIWRYYGTQEAVYNCFLDLSRLEGLN